jgi:hypothetical protein
MDGADVVIGRHEGLLESNSLYADLVGYWDDNRAISRVGWSRGNHP